MKRFLFFGVLILVLAAVPLAVTAQPEITLEPVSIDSFGIQSVVPASWTEAGPGAFVRAESPTDVTLIALQGAPLRVDGLLQAILPQLGLRAAPEPVGEIVTEHLTWTQYFVEAEIPGGGLLAVDVALAQGQSVSYIVLLQMEPDDHDSLYEQVFLPAVEAFAPMAAESPDETADLGYTSEDVTFPGGAEGVDLAGTLTLPQGEGPFPAIVLVSGSGPQSRDEALGDIPLKPFSALAEALTPAGIAVLRYDERGVGESSGEFMTALTTDFAADAAAAINYLKTRDDIDLERVGALGHSEGGLIMALLGAEDQADFIISLAGTGVSGYEVLLRQNRLMMEAAGAPEEQMNAQVAMLEAVLPLVITGDFDAASETSREHYTAAWDLLSEEQQAGYSSIEQFVDYNVQTDMAGFTDPWMVSFLQLDPAPYWAQTTVPVLAIFGGKDVQVDAGQNGPPIEAALAEAGNKDVTMMVIEGANHLFQAAETGAVQEYATLEPEFTPELIPTILDWLTAQGIIAS